MGLAAYEQDAYTIRALARRIHRTGTFGRAPKWAVESLKFGDYVRLCGPRPGVNHYNGYCLTERGITLIAES